jgi:uncharacterized protein YabE (DUF348 family)
MEATADTSPRPIRLPQDLVALVVTVVVVTTLAVGYRETQTPVTLVVDGQERQLRTHQDTVGALLVDVGLDCHPKDRITPEDLSASLEAESVVRVERARPVIISADGHTVTFYTHAATAERILFEARVSVGPYDDVEVKGELRPTGRTPGLSLRSLVATEPEPVRITVHRAVPFTVREDGRGTELHTTAPTVGEALRRAGLTLYLADGVEPGLSERVQAGMDVRIDRSVPVAVQVDGRTLRTRTHRERVDEVLADLKIVLTGQDYATPTLDAPLGSDATIRVVRVSERFEIVQDPIPFESAWQPDPDLEIDQQRLLQEGARGILERRIRLRYEDGHEVARTVENEYVAVPPTTKIMGYGTKIVVRTLDTPTGPVEYWRVIRMLATSYSASTAGTPRSSPWYGRTRTGEIMRFGIVAVDPRMIDLRTEVYVENYGVGYAGDTGGAIKGRRIDLGYDDDNLVLWYRWVDVYLLTPVPDQINYVLEP